MKISNIFLVLSLYSAISICGDDSIDIETTDQKLKQTDSKQEQIYLEIKNLNDKLEELKGSYKQLLNRQQRLKNEYEKIENTKKLKSIKRKPIFGFSDNFSEWFDSKFGSFSWKYDNETENPKKQIDESSKFLIEKVDNGFNLTISYPGPKDPIFELSYHNDELKVSDPDDKDGFRLILTPNKIIYKSSSKTETEKKNDDSQSFYSSESSTMISRTFDLEINLSTVKTISIENFKLVLFLPFKD